MLVFIQGKQLYILSERHHFPHTCLQLQPVKTFTNKSDDSFKMSFLLLPHEKHFNLFATAAQVFFFSFHLKSVGSDKSTFVSLFPGILCVENVPGTFLGVLPSGRLFPKAVRRSTGMTGDLCGLKI